MFKGKTKRGVDVFSTQGFQKPNTGTLWVLFAERSRALLFEDKGESLKLLKEFPFPQGRFKDRDFRDGQQPGRTFNSSAQSHGGHGTGPPRHSLNSEISQHDMAARDFAKTLAEMLENGMNSHLYNRLVLISEPRFLGFLKGSLPMTVKEKVVATFEKDFRELSEPLVRERIESLLSTQ